MIVSRSCDSVSTTAMRITILRSDVDAILHAALQYGTTLVVSEYATADETTLPISLTHQFTKRV